MAILGQDTFTGYTHILDHTPDVGGSWLSVPNVRTDGIWCYYVKLGHKSPYALTGGPYYLNIANVKNFYVQCDLFSWYEVRTPAQRVEVFGRYNSATGTRVRMYSLSSGLVRVQDFPSGSITDISCPGAFLVAGSAVKLIFSEASVKLYYKSTAAPAWALQGEHTTSILDAGKVGFNVFAL